MNDLHTTDYSSVRTAEDITAGRVALLPSYTQTYQAKVFFKDYTPIAMKTPEPLNGATVQNLTRKTGTITKPDGSFSIQGTPTDIIKITYVGLRTFEAPAGQMPKVIFLNEDIQELDEVVVTPRKPKKNKATTITTNSTSVTIKNDEVASKIRLKKILFAVGGGFLTLALIGGGILVATKKKTKKSKK